ncbi:MAG: protein BatD [Nitrospirae bacterium]|nr:protein BatD [Candidatus Troglogloeales bacterium]
MRKRLLYSVICVCLWTRLAFAQEVTFTATVDKNPVSQGDQFTLSFTLNSTGMGGGKTLKLPDLGHFNVVSGPSQSSQIQMMNGAVSSSITYNYVLIPKEVGKFTIGVASIEMGGKLFETKPIALEVVKGTARPQQEPNTPDETAGQVRDNLFLKASVDKTHVTLWEKINLTFKLYIGIAVDSYTVEKNPAVTGFWSEEIENPKNNISLTTETVNGKQYRVAVVRRTALFPTQAGALEISPMQLQAAVRVQDRRRRSIDPVFDPFLRNAFGRTVNYMVKSEPLKITVEKLPAGAPQSFKGAVGHFTMTTAVDKKITKTNEPINLNVTISGTGNLEGLKSPAVDFPTDFEQYPPKVSDNIKKEDGQIVGSKVFEYLVIPRYPGEKKIKPVEFSYFDLSKRAYVTIRSQPIALSVEQGAHVTSSLVADLPREEVRLLNQDIRFIKVGNIALSRNSAVFYPMSIMLTLGLLPLAGIAGAMVASRQRRAVMMDETLYRNRRAIKVARKGLRRAERLIKSNDGSPFYAELSRALHQYLGDKLNIQQAEISIDGTLDSLLKRSVNEEILTALKSLLERCEMARFAPANFEAAATQQAYDEARKVIIEVERGLAS